MKNRFIKRIHLFFSSLFIFLLHLPFVFAKVKPVAEHPVSAVVHADNKLAVLPLSSIDNVTAADSMYNSLKLASYGLTKQVYDYAMRGFDYLKSIGKIDNGNIITIADLSKSSRMKRLFVIDVRNCKMLFNTYVAHGMNSGQEFAKYFSNVPESNKSSLGFYETSTTYTGKHGYSLHLVGLEKGINDNAYERDIVMHAADYVSEDMIHTKGYLGRSQGCPALPQQLHKKIIDRIKNGTCLFIFGEDRSYLNRSVLMKNTLPLLAYK